MPDLSNLRDFIGWVIGQRVVDVTCGDPADIPDCDEEDANLVTVHFENGGTLAFYVDEDHGFTYCDPDEPDDDDDAG